MRAAPLSPIDFPLHGVRLIEASAGTGKTWTIAALYLRLILGLDTPPLWPPQILVVTYTRAATAELRERIRKRLVEAAAALSSGTAGDGVLAEIVAFYTNEEARAAAAQRLEIAAQWMDEAAIHTIDAWCQRMLAEHAVASGTPFGLALLADETELVAEAVRDYWRAEAYALDLAQAVMLREVAKTPRDLAKQLSFALKRGGEARVVGIEVPHSSLVQVIAERSAKLAELKELWLPRVGEMETFIAKLLDDGLASGTNLKRAECMKWLRHLREWTEGLEAMPLPTPAAIKRLSPAGIRETLKAGVAVAMIQAIEELPGLQDALRKLSLKPRVIAHALRWVQERLVAEKRRLAIAGFDDVKRRLADAVNSSGANALRDAIAAQYPVALIDEFQDTDPAQWRLFHAIYAGREAGGLFLIGDPKQAIYSFRGADIRTYLAARAITEPPHYTLSVNHRSDPALVAAVNRVFMHGQQWPNGAFALEGLDFDPVEAAGRDLRYVEAHETPSPLTFWLHDAGEVLGLGVYRARMADACATHIAERLAGGSGFLGSDGTFVPLRAADIAVLVPGYKEAREMQAAFAARGLRCVYLSDKDSVYESPEASDVLRWLRAVAEPGAERLLRAALATVTLDLSWDDLDRLNRDEAHWEASVERFRAFHQTWRNAGVLAMLQRLLHEYAVPARLLAPTRVGGERALTNLLHIAELLQEVEQTLDGEAALVRHLSEAIAWVGEAETSEEAIVRLESDAGLVKLVTIHKSKGLEYPLVYLPFACAVREDTRETYRLRYGADGELVVDLSSDDVSEDGERGLQESLRLLYVALTRARYACWLGVAPVGARGKSSQVHKSAVGWLLSGGETIDAGGELARRLNALRGGLTAIAVEPLPTFTTSVAPTPTSLALAPARQYDAPRTPRWWIASYSALRVADGAQAAPDTPGEDVLVEQAGADASVAGAVRSPASPGMTMADFPRGPTAGTFLHGLFEWAALHGFARTSAKPVETHDMIWQRCSARGWTHWAPALRTWLPEFLRLPLALPDAEPVCLAALGDGDRYQAELEFWFEARGVETARLDALVAAHMLGGAARAPLEAEPLNGMFKGFIDLVFEHAGRYYVADYKSNWLGQEHADYSPPALVASILQHRYEMQYCLYLLALHRQLRARLPHYDYDLHVGGAVYAYLRGVDGRGHGVHVDRPPRALIEAMDALFAGETADGR